MPSSALSRCIFLAPVVGVQTTLALAPGERRYSRKEAFVFLFHVGRLRSISSFCVIGGIPPLCETSELAQVLCYIF